MIRAQFLLIIIDNHGHKNYTNYEQMLICKKFSQSVLQQINGRHEGEFGYWYKSNLNCYADNGERFSQNKITKIDKRLICWRSIFDKIVFSSLQYRTLKPQIPTTKHDTLSANYYNNNYTQATPCDIKTNWRAWIPNLCIIAFAEYRIKEKENRHYKILEIQRYK